MARKPHFIDSWWFKVILSGLIDFLSFLACILPEKACFFLAEVASRILYFTAHETRQAAFRTLKVVFPDAPPSKLRRLTRKCFEHQLKNLVELFRYPLLTEEKIYRKISFKGKEHLDNALKKGKGVILLVAHFGNWELLGATWGILGYKINSFFLDARIDLITKRLTALREGAGITMIPRHASRRAIKALNDGEIVGVIADQDGGSGGHFTRFFGKLVSAPIGPAYLARVTDSAVIPNFLIRNPDDSYTMIVEPPLELVRTRNKKADMKRNTERMLRIYEEFITRYPDQWLWIYERWKRRRHTDAYLSKMLSCKSDFLSGRHKSQ